MIAALREHASLTSPVPQDAQRIMKVVEYLEACHRIFEKGILSHSHIHDIRSRAICNIQEGFKYFREWSESHDATGMSCIEAVPIISDVYILVKHFSFCK